MKNSNNAARQENKKALPKFILTVVLSLALGGVLGFALVTLNLQDFQGALDGAGLFFTNHAAPWLLIALPVVELAVCLPIYFSAKKQLAGWDGEDEAERAIIGQCAFQAYQAMCWTCMALWVVFAVGGMFFNWGFLPALAVCIVWGAGQSVYSWWCLKLDRPGGKL